jgi:hypothetical protein
MLANLQIDPALNSHVRTRTAATRAMTHEREAGATAMTTVVNVQR